MLRRGLILFLVFAASLAVADAAKRIILKDGSYQKVTKYEIIGDRVHYFSAERGQWEDVPRQMVDWTATKRFEQDQQTAATKAAADEAKARAEQEKEDQISAQEAISPEVAPNLHLPEAGGVFVFDTFGGTPQLLELAQSTSQTDDHSGTYRLKHAVNPLASKMATVELPGAHAKVQVHSRRPIIYLNIDTETDTEDILDANKPKKRVVQDPRPSSDAFRFQFVRLGEKKDLRILETIKTTVVEDTSYSQKIIHTVGLLTPGNLWIEIQPKEDLEPGEYAIEELLSEDAVNPYVWDFGINPNAPQNPNALLAGQKKPQATQNDADASKRMKD
jgi:hypothetical protein